MSPARRTILLSLVGFVLSVQSLSAQERITLGLTTRTGSTSMPLVIAEEKGFFKAEGLNGIVVIMQNQVVVNGVVTRNVDYGGTFSNFIGAALSGLPVRIVNKVMEGRPHIVDEMKNGDISLVFNTTDGTQALSDSASIRKTAVQ